jgi:predicted RNA binding protein YcfA (HicA-like mRNA interferase family)
MLDGGGRNRLRRRREALAGAVSGVDRAGLSGGDAIMTVRDVLRRLDRDGWVVIRTRVDHRQLKHPDKPGKVTVSGHPGDDIHPKTLASI